MGVPSTDQGGNVLRLVVDGAFKLIRNWDIAYGV